MHIGFFKFLYVFPFFRLLYENIQDQSATDISIAPVKWDDSLYDLNRYNFSIL
jgi:hypothetical protein